MTERTPKRTILQAGPPLSSMGGMAEVARTIEEGAHRADLGYEVITLDSGGGRGKRGYPAFPVAMARVATVDYDLLHLHVASKGSALRKSALARVAALRGRPYVIHLHGGGFATFLASLTGRRRELVNRFFHRAQSTVVLGESWRRLLVDELKLPESAVTVVPNGVPALAPVQPATERESSIVFVGGVTRSKGVDVLLDVVEQALDDERWRGWSVGLLGPTPDQGLVKRATELDRRSPGRVRLLGPTFGEDKARMMARAGVFVLPSRKEGMPLVVLEAMSQGVPCVVSEVGSVPEMIVDGHDGVLVTPGDVESLGRALTDLVGDAGRRESIGEGSRRRWLESFTDDAMVARLAGVWDRAISSA